MKRTRDAVQSALVTRRSKRLLRVSFKSETTNNLAVDAPTRTEFARKQTKFKPTSAALPLIPDLLAETPLKQSLSPDEPRIKIEYEGSKPSEMTAAAPQVSAPNIFAPYRKDLQPGQHANWIQIYNEIVHMRSLIETPVDRMGCGAMATSLANNPAVQDPRVYRFQLLVALMLSSQTKDEVNFAAMTTLHEHYRAKGYDGLCIEAVLALSEQEIDKCIAKVGFHTRKATYIKRACEMLRDNFGSDVPKTIEDVVLLPGVGPKMGHLLLQNGWGVNLGIGVDVHLHRLAQMWGWVPKSDNPEATRLALEAWLPREVWADINPLLVGFGQTVCTVKAKNCDVCTLSNEICKSANKKLARSELTEQRIAKLSQMRSNLAGLVQLRTHVDKLKATALEKLETKGFVKLKAEQD